MRFSVEDAIAAGLWVALGILALLSASDYWSTRTFLVTSEEVNHAHEVVEQLDHLLAEMTDAETGQRGYLITGSVRYLPPYERATAPIADTLPPIRVPTPDGAAWRSGAATWWRSRRRAGRPSARRASWRCWRATATRRGARRRRPRGSSPSSSPTRATRSAPR